MARAALHLPGGDRRHLPDHAGHVRLLAAGDHERDYPANRDGRRPGHGVPVRAGRHTRRALGLMAIFSITARQTLALINRASQPPRSGRSDVRSRVGSARDAGAAGTDPDDDAGNGRGARALHGARNRSGPRDPAPDGGRRPRRTRDVGTGHPVHRSIPLPALRAKRSARGVEDTPPYVAPAPSSAAD